MLDNEIKCRSDNNRMPMTAVYEDDDGFDGKNDPSKMKRDSFVLQKSQRDIQSRKPVADFSLRDEDDRLN